MLRMGRSRPMGGLARKSRVVSGAGLMALAIACQERDRLTFPTPPDGVGPVTTIDQPMGTDTTVSAGPAFFVNGRTIDLDGIDTVYFLVTGGNNNFLPLRPTGQTDTVRFGLPITTFGLSGSTILVEVYGVDSQGNQGIPSSRRIVVQ
jgi:hypothetical protein